jgi:prepilin peptidase CpaA
MIAQILLLILLPALLAAAAGWDLASFTIPNFLSFALVLAFVLFALALRLSPMGAGLHLLAGAIGLLIGFGLFVFGYIGGGDAKLYAGIALWLGPHDLLPYTFSAALLGGLLAVTLLLLRQLPLPAGLARLGWVVRLHDQRAGIPYGVALAAAALAVLPRAEILHLAASGLAR